MKHLVMDCALGRDSYFSIMTAFQNERVVIEAILVTDPKIDRTVHGMLHLLGHLAADIPVCRGCRLPLGVDPETAPEEPMKGQWPEERPSPIPAEEMLHRLAEKYPGELTILCCSPLTTVASFLQKYPQDAAALEQVVVVANREENREQMGFFFEPPVDPMAKDILLKSGVRTLVIPMEAMQETEEAKKLIKAVSLGTDTMIGRFLRHSTVSRKADQAILSAAAGILAAAYPEAVTCQPLPGDNEQAWQAAGLDFGVCLGKNFGFLDIPAFLAYYQQHEGEHHHEHH